MAKMNFFISGQALECMMPKVMVGDTINYFDADFSFRTSDWNGLKKYVHFQQGESVFEWPLDENDQITRDQGINLWAGKWSVYVHGDLLDGEEIVRRIVTNSHSFSISATNMIGGQAFPDVAPDLAAELLAKIARMEQKIEAMKKQNSTEEGGENSDSEDPDSGNTGTGETTDPSVSEDNVATDEEVNDMFDDIFGSDTETVNE